MNTNSKLRCKMSKQMDRRNFIKNTIGYTVGSVMGAAVLPSFLKGGVVAADYDIVAVTGSDYFSSAAKAVEKLGGMKQFISKGSRVGLLINSPWSKPGTYTNPDVALAVLKMCHDAGAKEIYSIDDASVKYWQRSSLYSSYSELVSLIKKPGPDKNIDIPKGMHLKKAEIAEALLECDVLINVPIVKHHRGTNFTANLKNMMGACPYSTNRFFHQGGGGYENPEFLSQCIADLNLVRKPDLCIADATEFITTNGPAGPGEIKKVNTVIAGTNPVAVDACGASAMNKLPSDILMIKYAYDHGLGEMDLLKLNIQQI